MSLLLDALKKAAQDKQKSTTPGGDDVPTARPQTDDEIELELHLQEQDDAEPEPTIAEPEPDNSTLLIEDGHEAIRPRGHFSEDLPTLSEKPQPPAGGIEDHVEPSPLDVDAIERASDDHDQVVPPTEAVVNESPVQAEAEPTPDDSVDEAPAPAAKITPPPVAPSKETDTRASASRAALDMMIHKSRHATERRNRRLRNLGILVFLFFLLVGGSYFYYDSRQQIAEVRQRQSQVTPVQHPQPVQAEPTREVVEEVSTPTQKTVAQVAHPEPIQAVSVSSAAPLKPPVQTRPDSRPAPPAKTMEISRKQVEDPLHLLLSRAFRSFNAGQYDAAAELYRQVLQREASNRDALLGVAAVAMKRQQYAQARARYTQLLMLDPKDSVARAGLSAIDQDVRSESSIKFMLREQPDAAHLHFALGALYAEQQRWPEAQQSFFDAWAVDKQNADYAYNLAVSLDQLGKYQQALPIYRQALQLAGRQTVEFSTAAVQARIDQLGRLDHE